MPVSIRPLARTPARAIQPLSACGAFAPLNFELGEAFQFDWSEEGLLAGGICYRVQASHLKRCASHALRLWHT